MAFSRVGLRWVFVAALVAAAIAPPAAAARPAAALDFAAVDAYLEAEMAAARIPGLALAVVQGDEIVYLRGFGTTGAAGQPVTPQTAFNIGSLAKAFTALAVMQQVEAGRVALDAPVQRYLPWFQVADPAASAQITVLDLLNHTSGLPQAAGNDYAGKHDSGDTALETRARALRAVAPNRPAGERWEYSNANYDVLGLIVETVSGESYGSYVQTHIFAPLGLEHTFLSREAARRSGFASGHRAWLGIPVGYTERVPAAHQPSGHQFASVEDLARLLVVHLNGGRYGDAALLSPAGIEAMRQTPVSSGPECATYSMHWGHARSCDSALLSMGGDAPNYKARVLMSPDARLGIVLLMNVQAVGVNGPRLEGLKNGVFDRLLAQPGAPAPRHNMPLVSAQIILIAVTLLAAAGLARALLTRRPTTAPGSSRLGGPWTLIIIWLLVLLWLLLLNRLAAFAAGAFSARPLRFLLENVPDLGWLIVLSAVVALAWAVVRSVLVVRQARALAAR